MALLERVSTLVRANLNDLIDKAEDPEKMIKQVILDMQNQLLQVKTQVAIAIADQHLLEKKQKENEDKIGEWMRKAELAVDKKEDDLARASLQRVESYREMSEGFAQQVIDQKAQVENLKSALRKLEQKLTEAQAKADLLIAQHRRARAIGKASDARIAMGDGSKAASFALRSSEPGESGNRRGEYRRPVKRTRKRRSHRTVARGLEKKESNTGVGQTPIR
jgi:phage shock protein A